MYMLKRVGLKIDLCETPERISLGVDEWGCFILFSLFQLGCVLLLIRMILWCQTMLNAFLFVYFQNNVFSDSE